MQHGYFVYGPPGMAQRIRTADWMWVGNKHRVPPLYLCADKDTLTGWVSEEALNALRNYRPNAAEPEEGGICIGRLTPPWPGPSGGVTWLQHEQQKLATETLYRIMIEV